MVGEKISGYLTYPHNLIGGHEDLTWALHTPCLGRRPWPASCPSRSYWTISRQWPPVIGGEVGECHNFMNIVHVTMVYIDM